ncbi:type II toxin-antitoxin system RelE/ParE family toxin [Burkholderiaceae bacterium UC74_6]
MSYSAIWTPDAEEDLERLFDLLLAPALERDADLDEPVAVIHTVRSSIQALQRFPFTCRKAGESPFLRELIISHGHTGYVALFDIQSGDRITIVAIRHQREDDYH